jgi:tagatose-6-phosphate ketose/aldose isomerase
MDQPGWRSKNLFALGSGVLWIVRYSSANWLSLQEASGISMRTSSGTDGNAHPHPDSFTLREILQQPALWPTTVDRVNAASKRHDLRTRFAGRRVLLTGAGTSAYAASAAAAACPVAQAVPTTDLLIDTARYLAGVDIVISLARSGDSPESAAVVEQIRALRPDIFQLAITCNPQSALTRSPLDASIFLDPRTNDRSLVMTSAFSNLVLAGLTLFEPDAVEAAAKSCGGRAETLFPEIDRACRAAAAQAHDRIVMLSSSPLHGWAQEARLKALEMTAGAFSVMAETFLGLRHGPMSFARGDTLILCLLSHDPVRRLYEQDLLRELRAKKIGCLVGVADPGETDELFDAVIPAIAPHLPDALRTPFEIVAPQLLGYHLSRLKGMNPDKPSPGGVINRVVQGVVIHPARPRS